MEDGGAPCHLMSSFPPATFLPNLVFFPELKQTAEEYLVALLRHLKSSDFQDMTPRSLCPALIDRSGKASFEQVSYDVLIELGMVAPTLLSKGPQHTQLFHRR